MDFAQPGNLTVARVRAAIEKVIRDLRYGENTPRRQEEIGNVNGASLAADSAEQASATRPEGMRKM